MVDDTEVELEEDGADVELEEGADVELEEDGADVELEEDDTEIELEEDGADVELEEGADVELEEVELEEDEEIETEGGPCGDGSGTAGGDGGSVEVPGGSGGLKIEFPVGSNPFKRTSSPRVLLKLKLPFSVFGITTKGRTTTNAKLLSEGRLKESLFDREGMVDKPFSFLVVFLCLRLNGPLRSFVDSSEFDATIPMAQ